MAAQRRRKKKPKAKSQRLSDAPVGALVPQPHGGALRNGGTNRGGSGRPPEYLRMRSRDVFERWLDWAERQTATGKKCETCGRSPIEPPADVMNQIGKTAGRFGFPAEDMISRQLVRERLQMQIDRLLAGMDATNAELAISLIQPVWFPA